MREQTREPLRLRPVRIARRGKPKSIQWRSVYRDRKDCKVLWDHRGHKDHKDLWDHKDQTDHKEKKDHRDRRGCPVRSRRLEHRYIIVRAVLAVPQRYCRLARRQIAAQMGVKLSALLWDI
jgi:hypothetical protein